jgi:hypothetical protein
MINWNDINDNKLPTSLEEVFVLAETDDITRKVGIDPTFAGHNVWIYIGKFDKAIGWDLYGTDNRFKVMKWAYLDRETRSLLNPVLGEEQRVVNAVK